MTILFICGSLSPGRDGVGDYSRRLAGEIIRQGHSASIIALNDRHIDTIARGYQTSDDTEVAVLRLPECLAKTERWRQAAAYIEEKNPEWLSLQFVPYAFQRKGLPFGLGRQLAQIGKGRKWHVMFHELWVGMDIADSLRLKAIGKLQQYLICHLIRRLNPLYSNTNTILYQEQLRKLGFPTEILPLFSNIKLSTIRGTRSLEKVVLVFFGSIHYGVNIRDFAAWLKSQQEALQQHILIRFVGKNGSELDAWTYILSEHCITFEVHGMQTEDNISALLTQSDIGISTTPYWLIEKSGSVAAMLQHGLPVVCIARNWKPRNVNISFSHDIINWNSQLQMNEILKTKVKYNSLHKVAETFIKHFPSNGFNTVSLDA